MENKGKYLTNRANERLKEMFRDQRTEQPGYAEDVGLGYIPQVATAKQTTTKHQLGTFELQQYVPDIFADSGQTREAYAACDVSPGDHVVIFWCANPDSFGFFYAVPCGGTGATVPTSNCANVLSGVIPLPIPVVISGIGWGLNDDNIDKLNKTYFADAPDAGGCTIRSPLEVTALTGDPFHNAQRFQVIVTAGQDVFGNFHWNVILEIDFGTWDGNDPATFAKTGTNNQQVSRNSTLQPSAVESKKKYILDQTDIGGTVSFYSLYDFNAMQVEIWPSEPTP